MTSPIAHLHTLLAKRVDSSSLAIFRILFGTMMFLGMGRFLAYGWVDKFYGKQSFFFKYWGFSWVHAWPSWGMTVHHVLVAVLALMVALGLFYRISIVLFFLLFTYLELIDVTYYLNHYYLISLLSFLMCFLPMHSTWSLDAWRGVAPKATASTVPAWNLYLLRFQVGIVYFFAGMAKATGDWLLHAQPLGLWLHARTDTPLVGRLLGLQSVAYAFSWAGFVFDTTIVAFLCWRKTRVPAYLVLVFFHLITGKFFMIGMFPVIMITCATLFFSPNWARTCLRRWQQRTFLVAAKEQESGTTQSASSHPLRFTWRQWGMATAVVLYGMIQLAMPLRHRWYGGDVLWHEQGMRFSWKVMVREKNGSVIYHVRVPENGRSWEVYPNKYLTDYQEREMAGQPDMIVQLAHHIAHDYQQKGWGKVEVRAETMVSLNGRRAQPIIDPHVDLTAVKPGLQRASWILPGPQQPPIQLRTRSLWAQHRGTRNKGVEDQIFPSL
jgi:vitamin K-dependent gamma-carboxylase